MKLLVLTLLAVVEVYTLHIEHPSQAHKDAASLLHLSKNTQQKYTYKEVILYLTPSEIKSLKENNILQVSNDELYHRYLENNQLSAQKHEQQVLKPVQELQEETPIPTNHKAIEVPLFYPFELLPLHNNGKLLEHHDKKWKEAIKKHLEESLHKSYEKHNTWTPILGKQNIPQIKTLLPNEHKAEENLLLLQHALNNYDSKNILSLEDFHRLQQELDHQYGNNFAESLANVFLKDDIRNKNHEIIKKPIQPFFLYQNQHALKGFPHAPLHPLRPTIKAQNFDHPVDHLHEAKTIFDTVKGQLHSH